MIKFNQQIRIEYAKEYLNEYDGMKSDILFSKPKIYDAGGDITKRWYIYFSYRNPETGKMERQSPIYLHINSIKNLKERTKEIHKLRNIVERMLKDGNVPTKFQQIYSEEKTIDIHSAIQKSLDIAKTTMKESSYNDYKYRLPKFEKWLNERNFQGKNVSDITRKTVTNFLNDVLLETSPRNRNNMRANLSIFFNFLEENEYIKENFIPKIAVLKTTPNRNKTYSNSQEESIFKILKEEDPLLFLYIKFISYNFLRPVEVCRLRVQNIDLKDAQLSVETKTNVYKTKIIPQILLKELDFIKNSNPNHFIFTPKGVGEWEVSEVGRRDYWSKRFKKIKKRLNLGSDYTIYSFRHTYITKLYRELRTQYPPFETKSRLMLITGHSSMDALEKYLRDIDAELPEDYSHLLE